ncbi:MAG TPA: hypothetical protein VL485_21240 [Ktedonobacteraceae bacterium]|nr:hypothetical protein [Ktedonobacteraceae bacterium]
MTFIVTIFVASLLGIIAWIGTLIKQVRLKQWGWFICTVLFTGIAMLIYLLTVPETSPQVLGPGNGQIYQSQPPMYYPPSQPSYPPVTNDPKWQ